MRKKALRFNCIIYLFILLSLGQYCRDIRADFSDGHGSHYVQYVHCEGCGMTDNGSFHLESPRAQPWQNSNTFCMTLRTKNTFVISLRGIVCI